MLKDTTQCRLHRHSESVSERSFFEKVNFEKSQQMTTKAWKLPSIQRVNSLSLQVNHASRLMKSPTMSQNFSSAAVNMMQRVTECSSCMACKTLFSLRKQ